MDDVPINSKPAQELLAAAERLYGVEGIELMQHSAHALAPLLADIFTTEAQVFARNPALTTNSLDEGFFLLMHFVNTATPPSEKKELPPCPLCGCQLGGRGCRHGSSDG